MIEEEKKENTMDSGTESRVSIAEVQYISDEAHNRVEPFPLASQRTAEITVRGAQAGTPATMDRTTACFLCASVVIVISCMVVVVLWYGGLFNPHPVAIGIRGAAKHDATAPPVTVLWIGEPQTYLSLNGNDSLLVNATRLMDADYDLFEREPRRIPTPPMRPLSPDAPMPADMEKIPYMTVPPHVKMPPEVRVPRHVPRIPRHLPSPFEV